jgi:hypothetical protein
MAPKIRMGREGLCLCKTFLEFFATPEDILSAYRLYLKKSWNVNISHGNLATLDFKVLSKLFMMHNPAASPKGFSFWRPLDLALLEEALQYRFIIAREGPFCRWIKLHHRQIFDVVAEEEDTRPTFHFMLQHEEGEWVLYFCPEGMSYTSTLSELPFIRQIAPRGDGERHCYLTEAAFLLQLEWTSHRHSPSCGKLSQFLLSGNEMSALLERFDDQAHSQLFAQLAFFGSEGKELKAATAAVLAVGLDGNLYQPSEEIANSVRKVVKTRKRQIPAERYPGDEERGEIAAAAVTDQDETLCSPCKKAKTFSKNMGGKAYVLKTHWTSYELLRILNWWTPENVATLQKCSRLAMCYYDIEALTLEADASGHEDLSFPFTPLSDTHVSRTTLATQLPVLIGVISGLDLECGKDPQIFEVAGDKTHSDVICEFVDNIFERRLESACAIYELILPLLQKIDLYRAAYQDTFERAGWFSAPSEEGDVEFEGCDDEESSGSEWDEPRCKRRRRKKPLSVEEIKRARALRRRKQVDLAFANTPWGLLERNLKHLANSFTVFAYNSEQVRGGTSTI